MSDQKQYMIFSFEKNAWWRDSSRGYTWDIANAGLYSAEEAHQICGSLDPEREEVMVDARLAKHIVLLERQRAFRLAYDAEVSLRAALLR